MKWTEEAEKAIRKAPFFVRKKVRARVEKEAVEEGKKIVTVKEVEQTRKRFLSGMEKDIKGYQVEGCFGPSGCPNRAVEDDRLIDQVESVLEDADLLSFLKSTVQGPLKYHHEFRVGIADCPNACAQPQIKDIGIIGACAPHITEAPCTMCESCVDACQDGAVALHPEKETPVIDPSCCMQCGKCITACPSGVLEAGEKGYKVLLGGKLGRHPRLGRPLPGIFSSAEVLQIITACIEFYKEKSRGGSRFAEVLTDADLADFVQRYGKSDDSEMTDDR